MKPVRFGVVAVVPQPRFFLGEASEVTPDPQTEQKYLVIRRSASVLAPNTLCFPGGGIEPGETPEEAVCREFREEIGTDIEINRHVWENITPWGVHLDWFLGRIVQPNAVITREPREVADVLWLTMPELLEAPDLLKSNEAFLNKVIQGEISLSF